MQIIITSLQLFFKRTMREMLCWDRENDECGEAKVRGTMDAGINNVIYMELHSKPKMVNSTCGKMIVAGTIDQGSTVLCFCKVVN
jgi:hypothetical protein